MHTLNTTGSLVTVTFSIRNTREISPLDITMVILSLLFRIKLWMCFLIGFE